MHALPCTRPAEAVQPPPEQRRSIALPAHIKALKERLQPPRSATRLLPFDDPSVDRCLGGGLPLGQLHEIGASGLARETGAPQAGFVAGLLARIDQARPVFWITSTDDLHAPGLLTHGCDPGRLILVRSKEDADTLAAMEVVLREGAAAAVVGEVGELERIASRRLQLGCLRHGVTGFVLRRWPYGYRERQRDATAAVTRWSLAPQASVQNGKEPGALRWRVALTHARGGRPGEWIMEVTDDASHSVRVVAALADHASEPQPRGFLRQAAGYR
jgi:protein ImuA